MVLSLVTFFRPVKKATRLPAGNGALLHDFWRLLILELTEWKID
jgi:hypothetical protein